MSIFRHITSQSAAANRYRYDFHARLQLPAAGLFSRPDSKAWDYPHVNPYLYCAANPIMLIDPTGEDIYTVDTNGNFIFEEQTKDELDKIRNYLGNILEVQKSFMKSELHADGIISSPTYEDSYGRVSVYSVVPKKSRKICKYLKNSTDVEWTVAYMTTKENRLISLIGTSHESSRDATTSFIIDYALKHQFKILRIDHYHDDGNKAISEGDIKMAAKVHNHFPAAILYIRFPNSDEKIFYDENSPTGLLPAAEAIYSISKNRQL